MNEIILQMKKMRRAMVSYVLTLYEVVLESEPKLVLEIGTGQAQSTRSVLSALKENNKGILVSVDRGNRIEKIPEELRPYLKHIVMDSHKEEALKKVEEVSKEYDLLIIDGDHSYEGAKKDFEMYVPLVKKGGLIFMHDIINQREGVKDFWKEITLPKVGLNYGKAASGIIPGLGIVQKI